MEKKINGIMFKTVAKEWDVYFDMALTMLEEIIANNKQNKKTVMIVPVGPTAQYPILAQLVNRLGVSLKNVHFFNMDEYMLSPEENGGDATIELYDEATGICLGTNILKLSHTIIFTSS